MTELDAAIAAAWPGLDPAAVTTARLGGLTNRVYRVEGRSAAARAALGGPAILRLAGAGTEAYIDRRAELTNARAAHAAGVAPAVLAADPARGLLATRCIEGAVTMTPALFASRPGAPARAGRAFATLHRSGQSFAQRFELFGMIDSYLRLLAEKRAALPEGYHATVAAAAPVREALAARPVPLAPCHCDPLCENFLDTGERMWIVDWEYSGMNDPYWDLGDLSVEAGFGPAQDRELLEAWCGAAPAAWEAARMTLYKAMCDLLWTLWGLIQHADGNPADDFWAYAANRFARCRALMARPDWQEYLRAAAAGA
jgi:thiamine kinase-like enzyme